MEKEKCILVTGAAGFIGANLVLRLMKDGRFGRIVGVDSLNDYYDVRIKEYRLDQIARDRDDCDFGIVPENLWITSTKPCPVMPTFMKTRISRL